MKDTKRYIIIISDEEAINTMTTSAQHNIDCGRGNSDSLPDRRTDSWQSSRNDQSVQILLAQLCLLQAT
jgi:hypothetical protein